MRTIQAWLEHTRHEYTDPAEAAAADAIIGAGLRGISRGYDLILDYLEDNDYPDGVISASIYLYKLYYLSRREELKEMRWSTRKIWWGDYCNFVLVRAENNYPEHKPLVLWASTEDYLPEEVKTV